MNIPIDFFSFLIKIFCSINTLNVKDKTLDVFLAFPDDDEFVTAASDDSQSRSDIVTITTGRRFQAFNNAFNRNRNNDAVNKFSETPRSAGSNRSIFGQKIGSDTSGDIFQGNLCFNMNI